ncbi:5010_t:CDS:2, partial [Racocetra fulgida]
NFTIENSTFQSSYNISFDTPAIGAVLGFDFDNGEYEKNFIGISFITSDQACKNAQEEVPNFDFEKTRELAVNAWEVELSKIRVD